MSKEYLLWRSGVRPAEPLARAETEGAFPAAVAYFVVTSLQPHTFKFHIYS